MAERRHNEAFGICESQGSSADVAACLNNLGNVALDRAGLDQHSLTRAWAEGKSAPPDQWIELTIDLE